MGHHGRPLRAQNQDVSANCVSQVGLGLLYKAQAYAVSVPPTVPQPVPLRGWREKVVQPSRQQMPRMRRSSIRGGERH